VLAQGKTGNPFFDCVGLDSGVPPFKSFVQANGNNAQTLAQHFISYLKARARLPSAPEQAPRTPLLDGQPQLLLHPSSASVMLGSC
jgi:hypothetical protein